MRIFSLVVTYLLVSSCFAPHMDALQRNKYRPTLPSRGQALATLVLGIYNAVLCVLWVSLAVDAKWDGLYMAAAYLPHAVWLGLRLPHIRLKRTARMARLWTLAALLMAVPMAVSAAKASVYHVWGVWSAAIYPVAQLAAAILYPLETARNNRFVRHQAERLHRGGVHLVGITGSAGKTSVKRLLVAALGPTACGTKGNYNTPLGIALSVKEMPAGTRWFVAEMGVGKPNDMRELLAYYTPEVGVVTCILPQHTAHFERVEDIRQEKCRLLDVVEWGICNVSVGYPAHATYGTGGDWWAENVVLQREGTDLDVCSRTERHHVHLPLAGRQAADNAVCAWAVARHLGVAPADIVDRWRTVKGEPHRLSLWRTERGVWVVDDSYNCNIQGARYALEYLSLFEGRKVVAASGIEEADESLGLNRRLGEMIAEACDVAVLVGAKHREALLEGIGDKVPIYCVDSTGESVELYRRILCAGDALLIMADYPM